MLSTEDLESDDLWDETMDDEGDADRAPQPVERFRATINKGQESVRIDKFIMNHMENTTRNKIQQAIEEGFVTINGNPTKSNYKIRFGDEIIVYDNRHPEVTEVIPQDLPLDIVYEDDHVMIVNKKPGMVVHPGCGNYTGTLVNGLAYYLQQQHIALDNLHRVGLVHRIDKDTSGLVVIAKTEEAMSNLAKQFKNHTVHRRYVALAWGYFDEPEGTVDIHIGRNLRFRKIMDVFPEGDHGKHAVTHYKVLESFNYVSLLELRLETGRTHQIRVHMKYLGHPLFGDTTYGGDRIVKGTIYTKYKQFVENCFKILPRQALHAKELGFEHPATKEWIQFSSELPDDILEVVEKWRSYTKGMTRQLKEGLDGDN